MAGQTFIRCSNCGAEFPEGAELKILGSGSNFYGEDEIEFICPICRRRVKSIVLGGRS